MTEGGAGVPLIANWKGTMPAGRVVRDLVDFTDLLPTFAEVAGAKPPQSVTFDGRSFAPQLCGRKARRANGSSSNTSRMRIVGRAGLRAPGMSATMDGS